MQPEQRPHDGALAAAAAAHDEEDGAALDDERQVVHDDEAAVRQRQPFDGDLPESLVHQILKRLSTTANTPSTAIIQTIELTTALVAASPTAAALLFARRPSMHPA